MNDDHCCLVKGLHSWTNPAHITMRSTSVISSTILFPTSVDYYPILSLIKFMLIIPYYPITPSHTIPIKPVYLSLQLPHLQIRAKAQNARASPRRNGAQRCAVPRCGQGNLSMASPWEHPWGNHHFTVNQQVLTIIDILLQLKISIF